MANKLLLKTPFDINNKVLSKTNEITPDSDNTYNIGDASHRYRDIYCGHYLTDGTHYASVQDIVAGSTGEILDTRMSWSQTTNLINRISPLSMAMSNTHSANKLAFVKGANITVEYSQDDGITWTDVGLDTNEKTCIFTKSVYLPIGRAKDDGSSPCAVGYKTRIILDAVGAVYCSIDKMLINISSAGNLEVKIEVYRNGDWYTYGTYNLVGWSGWNDIPLHLDSLGGSGASQDQKLKLTFRVNSVVSGYEQEERLLSIETYGENNWSSASGLSGKGRMSETGHLYDYDLNANAIFPAGINVGTFIGLDGTNGNNLYSPNNINIAVGNGYAFRPAWGSHYNLGDTTHRWKSVYVSNDLNFRNDTSTTYFRLTSDGSNNFTFSTSTNDSDWTLRAWYNNSNFYTACPLLPATTGTIDLGSSYNPWKDLYLSNKQYFKGTDYTWTIETNNANNKLFFINGYNNLCIGIPATEQAVEFQGDIKLTSDFKQVQFFYSGTKYASIGLSDYDLVIHDENGIYFSGADIKPLLDNSLALGDSSHRYTNLYLSGNAYANFYIGNGIYTPQAASSNSYAGIDIDHDNYNILLSVFDEDNVGDEYSISLTAEGNFVPSSGMLLGTNTNKWDTLYADNLSDGVTTKTMTEVLAGGGGNSGHSFRVFSSGCGSVSIMFIFVNSGGTTTSKMISGDTFDVTIDEVVAIRSISIISGSPIINAITTSGFAFNLTNGLYKIGNPSGLIDYIGSLIISDCSVGITD